MLLYIVYCRPTCCFILYIVGTHVALYRLVLCEVLKAARTLPYRCKMHISRCPVSINVVYGFRRLIFSRRSISKTAEFGFLKKG